MTRTQFAAFSTLAGALAAATLLLLAGAGPAFAHKTVAEALTFHHPWARPLKGGRDVTAAYMHVVNAGATDDRIIAASTPFAEAVEIHTHVMGNGMMRMVKINALEIPAGGELMLQPGGHHLMIFGADAEAFTAGSLVPMTLTLAEAGTVEVQLMVEDGPSHGDGHDHHGGHGDHSHDGAGDHTPH